MKPKPITDLSTVDQRRRAVLVFFLERYKEGDHWPNFPEEIDVSRSGALRLLEEFAEWDSVVPTYTDHLALQFFQWEAEFLKHIVKRQTSVPLKLDD